MKIIVDPLLMEQGKSKASKRETHTRTTRGEIRATDIDGTI